MSPENKNKENSNDVFKMAMKNITLKINKIHIRYEDDYYFKENPFAYGFICDVFFGL